MVLFFHGKKRAVFAVIAETARHLYEALTESDGCRCNAG
nr:MAG TPA: hypothetical protein [Caudoviricetes sp.]